MLPKSISLNLSTGIKPNESVLSDPVQLHQLIVNLCVNARDSIGEKGKIDIELSRHSINDQTCNSCHQSFSGEFIKISVRDTGAGMNPEVVSQIFEPFFTTKDVGKGTGMGLSTVHGIVHNQSGHIVVNSRPGQGTEFAIFLPVSESRDIDTEGTEQGPIHVDGRRQRILVVDDEESIAELFKEQLGQYHFEVDTFSDSSAAYEHFLGNVDYYDLVITDQAMPGLLGTEMARQMLKSRPDLPIILCTGYQDPSQSEEAESLPLGANLSKPVTATILVETVNDILTKKH